MLLTLLLLRPDEEEVENGDEKAERKEGGREASRAGVTGSARPTAQGVGRTQPGQK